MKTDSEQQELDKNLLDAVSKNEITKVKPLLQQGANINAIKTSSSLASLHIAVQNRNHKLVELLLTEGANPNLKTTVAPRCTALHIATKLSISEKKEVSKCEDVISLIKAGADLKIKDYRGDTFLDFAKIENNGFYIQLINMLANCIDNGEKKLAFSMGRHPELGKNSLIQTIGEPSIIKKILEKADPISLDINDIPENHQEKVKEKHAEIKKSPVSPRIDIEKRVQETLLREQQQEKPDGPPGGRSI